MAAGSLCFSFETTAGRGHNVLEHIAAAGLMLPVSKAAEVRRLAVLERVADSACLADAKMAVLSYYLLIDSELPSFYSLQLKLFPFLCRIDTMP